MRWRPLLFASLLLSVVYILTTASHFPGRFAVKAGSIVALSVFAWANGHRGLSAGLLLSSAGDALLDLGPGLFIAGLIAFLCAHLTYTATFLIERRRERQFSAGRIAAMAGVIAFTALFGGWLAPAAGALALPVACYIVAITAMVLSSLAGRFESNWVAIGAVLFLISDAILATDKFRAPLPMRDYSVWCSYYAGQFLIAVGYCLSRRTILSTPSQFADRRAAG